MKTTIVFRGLMVLHQHGNTMEIGFVDALRDETTTHDHNGSAANHANHRVNHIPRILTTKDGVLSSIFDLRNRPELETVRNWSLKVTNPSPPASGITLRQTGDFNRTAKGSGDDFEKDFRWITDMEASDLHGRDLSLEINTRQLLFVLTVPHGEFYTHLRSPAQRRRRRNSSLIENYGPIAAAVGCEINFEAGGGVKLMAGGPKGSTFFTFEHDEGTVYEFSNSPPDVPTAAPISLNAPNHFHMYYDKLFKNPQLARFDLLADNQAPAPDPTVCGVVYLGTRQGAL